MVGSLRFSFALAVLVAVASGSWGCYSSTMDPEHVGADGDADADADADADGDVDADADGDGDVYCNGSILCEAGNECCATAVGEECVATTQSFQHCGGCGEACDPSSASLCLGGECACGDSGLCAGTPEDLCCAAAGGTGCTDTRSDPESCGSCDNNCVAAGTAERRSDRCIDGACSCGDRAEPCEGDLSATCCPDADGNASCRSVLNDFENCGGCGLADRSDIAPSVRGDGIPDSQYACSPETANLCRIGQCVCGIPKDPFEDPGACLGGRASTCCVPDDPEDQDLAICADLDTSELHCGACNHPCDERQECRSGICG